ncbi:hypothetical protein DPMN_131292 [Dreissena polymorpha]|uniref:Uncharacterized protein n=1 Tax=Dreissena polymorpha TaxID=45954 RepID=A0A9D4K1X1_DREPO|nr:hypothetical protein DPMN_131292 [Dreissena polymorpha]
MAQTFLVAKKTDVNRSKFRCNWCFQYYGAKLERHQKQNCTKCPVGAAQRKDFVKKNVATIKEDYAAFPQNMWVPEGWLKEDRMYTAHEVYGILEAWGHGVIPANAGVWTTPTMMHRTRRFPKTVFYNRCPSDESENEEPVLLSVSTPRRASATAVCSVSRNPESDSEEKQSSASSSPSSRRMVLRARRFPTTVINRCPPKLPVFHGDESEDEKLVLPSVSTPLRASATAVCSVNRSPESDSEGEYASASSSPSSKRMTPKCQKRVLSSPDNDSEHIPLSVSKGKRRVRAIISSDDETVAEESDIAPAGANLNKPPIIANVDDVDTDRQRTENRRLITKELRETVRESGFYSVTEKFKELALFKVRRSPSVVSRRGLNCSCSFFSTHFV